MNPTYTYSPSANRDAGITAARNAYNAQQPLDANGNPTNQLADNAAYIAFVLDRATESYCKQYGLPA